MKKEHNTSKKYYESRAKLTLYHFYSSIYSENLLNSDRPDLLDIDNNTGIEITRAFYDNYAELYGLLEHYKNKNINEIPKNTLDYMEELGGLLIIINNILYGITCPAQWVSTSCIEKCFIDKIQKLNNGLYSNVHTYDLFIYSPGFDEYDEQDVSDLLINLKKINDNYAKKYRYVYIDDFYKIYQCDLVNCNVDSYSITKEIAHLLCVNAEKEI